MAERRVAFRILVGKPKRKRLFRPTHRWEVNIKMDVHEMGRETWTGLRWLGVGTGGGYVRMR